MPPVSTTAPVVVAMVVATVDAGRVSVISQSVVGERGQRPKSSDAKLFLSSIRSRGASGCKHRRRRCLSRYGPSARPAAEGADGPEGRRDQELTILSPKCEKRNARSSAARSLRGVRLERRASRYCRDEGEIFRVSDGGNGQIHIQQRPIQVVWAWPFDGGQLLDGGLPEPRKFRERQEKLFIAKKQPETVY